MNRSESETLNPWLTMWTQPRATIQQIVDTDPRRFVLLLAAISGFFEALDRASARDMGDTFDLPVIFIFALVLGPLGGLVTLYLGAALIGWTGRWLDGKATYEQIRAAIAWSSIPLIWLSLLWIPELILVGEEMFTSQIPRVTANPSLGIFLLLVALVQFVGLIWFVVVYLNSLGQVQQFSAWKALGNVCLAALVFVVPFVVITFGIFALLEGSPTVTG